MWTSCTQTLPRSSNVRYDIAFNAQPATFDRVLHSWQEGIGFRTWFNSMLAASPFTASRWETSGVNQATRDRPFEFALHDDPRLVRQPDVNAYAKHSPNARPSSYHQFYWWF
jgi:hypothetical protein